MKKILLLALFLSVSAKAQTARINAAINNIPQSFSTAAGSLVLSELKNPKTLFIDNRTGTEIEVNCTKNHNTLPLASERNSFFVNASTAWTVDEPRSFLNAACFVRSVGATISTGILVITATEDNYHH